MLTPVPLANEEDERASPGRAQPVEMLDSDALAACVWREDGEGWRPRALPMSEGKDDAPSSPDMFDAAVRGLDKEVFES